MTTLWIYGANPMGTDTFYVTTPIYYVNDKPHIGHAYTTILGDVLARYHRLLATPTFFLTGTDEHGQKVDKAAKAKGISPQEQCDTTVVRFQELWEELDITHDDFIRTTEERHKTIVAKVLQDLFDRGLIYKAEYQGRYCVTCERFFTDKDLEDSTTCPECGKETEELVESNYFFKMSEYQDWLVNHINTHPDFIQPSFRANETLGFLKKPLGDLCVSRPKARMSWGIELPFDSDYVCYVWFDALLNYITAIGYGSDEARFAKWWPVSYHLIGKDILTTHTVYWPTMLKAMGVEMPKTIFAHGWWLVGRDKMSKSLGNVVNPMDMARQYGVDAFRYFLMAEMTLGQDASFTEEAFIGRYNSDLANDLGNLLSRVVKMTLKQVGGVVPKPGPDTEAENELKADVLAAVEEMQTSLAAMRLDRGLEQVMNAVRSGNRYMERTAPWKLAKTGETERLNTVLYSAAEALRIVSGLLMPVMPEKMEEVRSVLGLSEVTFDIGDLKEWGKLPPGSKLNDVTALFQRIKIDEPKPQPKKSKEKKKVVETKAAEPEGVVDVNEFFKSKLKTAKVLEAGKVEGADKLLKLQIDVGGETRQIVAGVAQFYQPEELVGRTIVVVANLKPATIRGVESNGMLLAAKKGKELKLVGVDGDVPGGWNVG